MNIPHRGKILITSLVLHWTVQTGEALGQVLIAQDTTISIVDEKHTQYFAVNDTISEHPKRLSNKLFYHIAGTHDGLQSTFFVSDGTGTHYRVYLIEATSERKVYCFIDVKNRKQLLRIYYITKFFDSSQKRYFKSGQSMRVPNK